jgi:hypothetical protein
MKSILDRSQDNVFGIVTRLRIWRSRVRVPADVNFYLFSKIPRQELRPINTLFNGNRWIFSGGKAAGDMRQATHLNLGSQLRMSGAITPLPCTPGVNKDKLIHNRA